VITETTGLPAHFSPLEDIRLWYYIIMWNARSGFASRTKTVGIKMKNNENFSITNIKYITVDVLRSN
jgi:hypothetical protein